MDDNSAPERYWKDTHEADSIDEITKYLFGITQYCAEEPQDRKIVHYTVYKRIQDPLARELGWKKK